ncbi:hypothetical protein BOTBODRAFT_28963 [Botryobasidium botryosum FD-172 SS1]|uniref:AB hydrolase-1 domain-containing protein n=1 Tax=Botryobasidium botryosum (strain FD-172 SS1) TaxID=930990 RepID=A0A067N469_BOTB1|nr:hypothetical protein BOTBODRAFT_28963 [Botryobasidium botryosum FD-172 SS1]
MSLVSTETYSIKDDIKVVDQFFKLPLDYSQPDGEKIQVFARTLVPGAKAKTEEEEENLPYFLYLQGGPGYECSLQVLPGANAKLHEKGYRTLWLDQRGTGLSTVISAETFGDKTDEEKAAYLKHFRADNIVRDCEAIRKILLGHKKDPAQQKWSVLGQSYGGFCSVAYLSLHPEGLKEVFLTGGLPPLISQPDEVYHRLKVKVVERNKVYYEKYPQDVKRVRDIIAYLEENTPILPSGGKLTPRRFQQLGVNFGLHGGLDRIHQFVLKGSSDLALFGKLTYKLLYEIDANQPFDRNPLYAVLHESIYCQGEASRWSAERVVNQDPQFSWPHVKGLKDDNPIYFTGEMVFSHMFDDYSNLVPLKGVAEILAQDESWGTLYDVDQLQKNEVKVTAACFIEDMFVDFGFSQETASKIKGIEQYITNQMYHNAIRTAAEELMGALFRLSKRQRD